MDSPKTLLEAVQYFSDAENCRQFMIAVRWADGIVLCPTCGSDKVSYLKNAKLYFCKVKHPKQKDALHGKAWLLSPHYSTINGAAFNEKTSKENASDYSRAKASSKLGNEGLDIQNTEHGVNNQAVPGREGKETRTVRIHHGNIFPR